MSDHSAAGPATGYQYQADYALHALIRDGGPGRSISLEMHDDVAWDHDGQPLEKLQIKHRVQACGGLGDASDALWRTLGAWMDAGEPARADGPGLYLVSTGTAAPDTAAYLLRPDNYASNEATERLRTAATDSTNTGTAPARARFLELTGPAQYSFVSRIRVLDGAPLNIDLDKAIRGALWTHLPHVAARQDEFMHMLWGWWHGRVVEMLSWRFYPARTDLRAGVDSAELASYLTRLSIDFSDRGLPEYGEFDIATGHPDLAGLDDEVFVHQLNLIDVHPVFLRRAIVEYYRATASETRWLERDFLCTDDVQRYERKLIQAWEVALGLVLTRMPSATEEERINAGQALLADVMSQPVIRIRDMVDQDFYFRGKHHMLAQDGILGWHPDFRERLTRLLGDVTISA